MLAKCANPGCGTPFLYLKEGRLFHLPVRQSENGAGEPSVEHFWLCDACAAHLIVRTEGRRIAIVDGASVVQGIFQGGSPGGEA